MKREGESEKEVRETEKKGGELKCSNRGGCLSMRTSGNMEGKCLLYN